MAKRNKPGKYSKKKKAIVAEKIYDYKEYVEHIKTLKKYNDSLDYLSLFADSIDDTNTPWKFKSNLQTFIKKHILIKDIFGSKPFQNFQHYITNMSGSKQYIESCVEIVRRLNAGETFELVKDLLVYKIKPLSEEELESFLDKLKKRCVILIENN